MMLEERILAIDFGSKRIGLALSDPLKIFAYPYKTLSNDEKLIPDLLKIISENKVVKIILGYPLKENGEKSETTKLVEDFNIKLSESTSLPVILRDERYSSSIAQERILQSVKSKKKRQDKSLIDKTAAAVILQEFLDEEK